MSKLSSEKGQRIAEDNLNKIYHLAKKKYLSLNDYLSGELRNTLFSILNYIQDKNLIIQNHKYLFFLDTTRLTYQVRKKASGTGTSSRHINLLCALGLLEKEPQNQYRDKLIEVNKVFLSEHPEQRPINVFIIRRYTDKYLESCEKRARRLQAIGITTGNISFNILMCHGLEDIAKEVYPNNNKLAPEVKKEDYQKLLGHMRATIEKQGYITREQIFKDMEWNMEYLEQLRRIFKQDLSEVFNYHSPTNQERRQYNLKDRKYIYTKRGI